MWPHLPGGLWRTMHSLRKDIHVHMTYVIKINYSQSFTTCILVLFLVLQQMRWPRGKVLGGSSSINHMLYVRGNSRDFNQWAADGCRGWNYESVLPYFLKAEHNHNRQLSTNSWVGSLKHASIGYCANNMCFWIDVHSKSEGFDCSEMYMYM